MWRHWSCERLFKYLSTMTWQGWINLNVRHGSMSWTAIFSNRPAWCGAAPRWGRLVHTVTALQRGLTSFAEDFDEPQAMQTALGMIRNIHSQTVWFGSRLTIGEMTDNDKNVLVLTKENFFSNKQSMRNQHPLFCPASDPRELNDSL